MGGYLRGLCLFVSRLAGGVARVHVTSGVQQHTMMQLADQSDSRDSQPVNFRQTVLGVVAEVLETGDLVGVEGLCSAVVSTIDMVHSYTEEGVRLFPEVLITTDIDPIVKSLANAEYIQVGISEGVAEGIATAIKRCAPLARDGWIIAVELQDKSVRYGLLSVEASDLSPSVYRHAVGDLSVPELGNGIVFVRGLGAQRVEVRTRLRKEIITVSLREQGSDGSEIGALADAVTKDLDPDGVTRDRLRFFFAKVLGDSLRRTHGCIVAVVADDPDSILRIRQAYRDGAHLKHPVDLAQAVSQSQEGDDQRAWMRVRNYRSLLTGMLSHDGITLISSKGRILSYNVFVPRKESAGEVRGGARSRAFDTLSSDGLILCGLAVSQDGGSKLYWEPNE